MYIDIEKAKNEFLNYVSSFKVTFENLYSKDWNKLRLEHSLRVMELSKEIAINEGLNTEDIEIATVIGLLHDIARFEQYTKYKSFSDFEGFDHGNYGVEILNKDIRKYIESDKYDNIIKKAIKNHNKFEIEQGLSDRELLFAKIIRDADKIDILYEATIMFWDGMEETINNLPISDSVLEIFLNKKLIKNQKGIQYKGFDDVLRIIAFIFDINFKSSFKILKKEDYINKIFNLFNLKDKEKFEIARNFANDFINKNAI